MWKLENFSCCLQENRIAVELMNWGLFKYCCLQFNLSPAEEFKRPVAFEQFLCTRNLCICSYFTTLITAISHQSDLVICFSQHSSCHVWQRISTVTTCYFQVCVSMLVDCYPQQWTSRKKSTALIYSHVPNDIVIFHRRTAPVSLTLMVSSVDTSYTQGKSCTGTFCSVNGLWVFWCNWQ